MHRRHIRARIRRSRCAIGRHVAAPVAARTRRFLTLARTATATVAVMIKWIGKQTLRFFRLLGLAHDLERTRTMQSGHAVV